MRGTFSPSCLPFPLRNPGFGVRDDRNVRRYRRASRMLSEMLWGGSFHSHIMTIVGRRATLARTVKLDGELRCPAMPTIQTANTQTAATTALIDASCMVQAYGPSLNGAVPDCTQGPRARRVVHNRTDSRPQKCKDRSYAVRRPRSRRNPYAVHRWRRHRAGRGCDYPQNAGTNWREPRRSRPDERAMALRTPRGALALT